MTIRNVVVETFVTCSEKVNVNVPLIGALTVGVLAVTVGLVESLLNVRVPRWRSSCPRRRAP